VNQTSNSNRDAQVRHAGVTRLSTICSTLVLCSASLLSITSQASEAPVKATLDPASPIAPHDVQKVSPLLHLTNATATAVTVRLEGRPLVLKGGTAMARITFPGPKDSKDPKDFLEVVVPSVKDSPGGVDQTFDVSGLEVAGSYEGAIDVILVADGAQRTRVPIVAARQGSTFDPVISGGSSFGNGLLTLKPTSASDSRFSFVVENPKGNADAKVVVSSTGLSGKDGHMDVRFEPSSFDIAAGSSQPVDVILLGECLSSSWFSRTWGTDLSNSKQSESHKTEPVKAPVPLASGESRTAGPDISEAKIGASAPVNCAAPTTTMMGKIVVTNHVEPAMRKQFDVVVQPAYTPNWTLVWIVSAVILGTLTSILIGTVVPSLMARQKAWNRLNTLKGSIESAVDRGSPAELALLTQWHRVDYLAHDIWWSSTRGVDLVSNVNTLADQLEKRTDIIARTTQLRRQVRSTVDVPVSIVPGIERSLDDVVKQALVGDPVSAETQLQAVQSKIDDSTLAQQVQDSLKKRIADLRQAIDAIPATADEVMRARLDALLANTSKLDQQLASEDLLRFDRECFAAHLYFVRYLEGVIQVRNPDSDKAYWAAGSLLVGALLDGPLGLWRADAMVQSMEIGVLKETIEAAFRNKKVHIEARPSKLIVDEMVDFTLVFDDRWLADSPLISSFDIRWTFDDNTNGPRGMRCIHFFQSKLFKAEKRRELSMPVKITVTVNVSDAQDIVEDMTLHRERYMDKVIARGEVLSTVASALGAIAITLISHQTDIHVFSTISDFVNPFLWGFGIDRMKSLIGSRG